MKLALCTGLVGLSFLAPPASAATRYAARSEVPILSEARADGHEIGRISLGAKVETSGRTRGFAEVTVDGKKGFVRERWLSKAPLSANAVCKLGRAALAKENLSAAVVYLRAAFDANTKNRACMEALAQAYRSRNQLNDETAVRAKLRLLERWMVGAWCDAAQRLVLALTEDGSYTFKGGEASIGSGKYDLRADELHLIDEGGAPRSLVLYVKRRGNFRILVARSADELQRDFCPVTQ